MWKNTKLTNQLEKKNSLRNLFSNEILAYPVPANLSYIFSVGSVLGLYFVMQILTGIFLAMHYTPDIAYAYESIQHIMTNVEHGSTIRYMHANGASMIFICMYIHIAKGIFFRSYTHNRRNIWWTGIIIFVLMMATAFLGYILPWGQMSFWGATVITNLLTALPFIGESLKLWVWGGHSVGAATVTRFYSLHYFLPVLTSGAIFLHLQALHKKTSSNGIQIASDSSKLPFHPYFSYKDLVAFLFSLLIFSFFVFFEPNYLGHPENYIPANPFVTPEHIVPEWYFTPFYAILRACPNKYGGVISMIGSIAVWGIIPMFKINISTRSVFESEIHKFFFFGFIFTFLCLLKLGGLPPTEYYVNASKAFTVYYFIYFLIIIPNLYIFEGSAYYSQNNNIRFIRDKSENLTKNHLGVGLATTIHLNEFDGLIRGQYENAIQWWSTSFLDDIYIIEYVEKIFKFNFKFLNCEHLNVFELQEIFAYISLYIILILAIYFKSTKNNFCSKYFSNQNIIIRNNLFKTILYIISLISFIFTIYLCLNFDITWPSFQYVHGNQTKSAFVQTSFGIDGISLCFIVLTTFIFTLLFMYILYDNTISIYFLLACVIIEVFLILSFYTINLLLFYFFFESVLIPMFLLIIFFGSSQRRVKASIYFLLYTLIGSIFLLYAILYFYNNIGTLNYQYFSLNLLTPSEELILWMAFFFPFAVKIPMFPFHIWLPEAHVEAPTIGSIILASLLLKLGGYGFLRFTIPLFPYGNEFYIPLVYMLGITGIIFTSLVAMRQIDIKRIIAYSSIAHMNLIVLGLFSRNICAIEGSVYLMIGHGIVSTALFFCVGVLYDRYHTRIIYYYGGLVQVMPRFAFFFFLFSFANMGFPGTINFIGEFLILVGIIQDNLLCGILAASSTVLSAIYSVFILNRINFGTLKTYISESDVLDLTSLEYWILLLLSIITIWFGLYSQNIFNIINIGAI